MSFQANTVDKDTKFAKKAALLSIIPGLGQFYNKQWGKGAFFLVFSIAFIIVFKDLFNMGLWGIVTLGEQVPRDNSIFLLAEGIIALIVIFFGLAFYYFNIKDAYAIGKRREEGFDIPSIKEQYQVLLAEGYPYIITSPAFILLVFSVIFPILFYFVLPLRLLITIYITQHQLT